MRNVRERGDQLRAGLEKLVKICPEHFQGVRGWGLLLGIVLQPDCGFTAPQLASAALNEKLLLVAAGPTVLRMVPPLSISARDIRQLLRRLEATCRTTFQI